MAARQCNEVVHPCIRTVSNEWQFCERVECTYSSNSRLSCSISGVLNVLEGCDREIEMKPGLTEAEI